MVNKEVSGNRGKQGRDPPQRQLGSRPAILSLLSTGNSYTVQVRYATAMIYIHAYGCAIHTWLHTVYIQGKCRYGTGYTGTVCPGLRAARQRASTVVSNIIVKEK